MSGETIGTQLTRDGREVDHAAVVRSRAPLSAAQCEILRWLREHRSISSTAAGVIVHAHRPEPCKGRVAGSYDACCDYAASDGGDAMKRIVERGLARKVTDGLWMVNLYAG